MLRIATLLAAVLGLAAIGPTTTVVAADEVVTREVTPEEIQAAAQEWTDALWSFYATGEPDLAQFTTSNGLERLRGSDWRFRAVESGDIRLHEEHELVDASGREPWEFTEDGEQTSFGVDITVDIAPYAETFFTGEESVREVVTGRQRRVLNVRFEREPGAEAWLIDGIGPPADPDYTVGLREPAPPRPCPVLRTTGRGDALLAKPWCTADGDGRVLPFGRRADAPRAPEIFVERAPCGPNSNSAYVMYLGSPPGSPIGTYESGDYVHDPRGVFPDSKAYRRDIRLPKDAISTGITNGRVTIWTSESLGPNAIIVQIGQRYERWPRSREGCGA